jgi:hypothetical protein
MKKYLPIILLVSGILALGTVVIIIRGRAVEPDGLGEEGALIEVSLNDRPVASLTPTQDGHWLKLKIEKLEIEAESLDYIISYKLPDGRTQGVPGTIKLAGQDVIERELLLGSESSGKFRYDEGVEEGALTLRYRNDKGQLLIKFETDFKLQTAVEEAISVDGEFAYVFEEEIDGYSLVMKTFGVPEDLEAEIASGPWGVFVSSEEKMPGEVTLKGISTVLRFTDIGWNELANNASEDTGIFVGR